MKTTILQYSLALLLTLNLNATEIYSVDTLILKALENAPDLQISAAEHKASQSRIRQAEAAYLPEVNMHLNVAQDSMKDTSLVGNLSLKQIIYDFKKTSANVHSFTYESNAFSMNNAQKISNKKRDVKSAYYSVLQAIALIDVHLENVKLNKSQLYRAKKYFEAGIRTKIDISDAKVELIKAKIDLNNAQHNLALAYASLDQIVGFKNITNDYKVYAKVLDLTNLYHSLHTYPFNLKDAISYAYKNRYDIKQYTENLKASKAKEELASSEYYPQFYLGADYTHQKVNKLNNLFPQEQWQASLNLDWNLYQGGVTDARTQERRVQIAISQASLNDKELFIKKETTQAYVNLYKAKDAVELAQTLLEASNEKFNQSSKRYEYGLADYIELQQSRQGYIDAKATLIVHYYEYYKSIAILDNSIGK